MDKVRCSSSLPVCVHVLSGKDVGQVGDLGRVFFLSIDWCTGIKKKVLLCHFNFLCQVPILSSPLVFSLHSLCTSLIYHFICGAVAILLHLASLLGCCLGVRDEMASGHSTKKIYRIMEKKTLLRSFSLSLPQHTFRHVRVSMRMHAHTHSSTHTYTLMWLLHTSFNTYRCRAVWFS